MEKQSLIQEHEAKPPCSSTSSFFGKLLQKLIHFFEALLFVVKGARIICAIRTKNVRQIKYNTNIYLLNW